MFSVHNLTVRYNSSGLVTDAVRGVSFIIEKGSFTGLVGESGSGKSSVIMAAMGLLPEGTEVSRFNTI